MAAQPVLDGLRRPSRLAPRSTTVRCHSDRYATCVFDGRAIRRCRRLWFGRVPNLAGIKVGAGLQTLETLNGGGDVAPGLERRPIADGIRHLAMFIDRGERLAAVPVNDFGGHRRNQTWLFQGKRPLGLGAVDA
jgi:hypothetical protein